MNVNSKEKITLEIDSYCVCTNEDGTPSDDCFGCWQHSMLLLDDLMNDWRETINADWNTVKIVGHAMGWQRRSGEAVVPFNKVLKSLTINGDFNLNFVYEDETLTVIRSSHDEPMGAKFLLTLIADEEEE
jgi:hypothetical protein